MHGLIFETSIWLLAGSTRLMLLCVPKWLRHSWYACTHEDSTVIVQWDAHRGWELWFESSSQNTQSGGTWSHGYRADADMSRCRCLPAFSGWGSPTSSIVSPWVEIRTTSWVTSAHARVHNSSGGHSTCGTIKDAAQRGSSTLWDQLHWRWE